jgi:SAM-dependent methyltransferase
LLLANWLPLCSMDLTYEAKYYQLEEQHWWFASRCDAVYDLIRSLKLPTGAAILEISCSCGPLMQWLRKQGYTDVTGTDVSTSAIELAKACGVPHISVIDGAALEFEEARFDLIIASDVLEHIEDESNALREWTRVLQPNGHLLVFVLAHYYLWSKHNVVNHHFRRYSRTGLVAAISRAGLWPVRNSLWNAALYLFTAALRIVKRRLVGGSATMADSDLPMGVSVFALAEKPV